jgi:hypothetical protein
MHAVTHGTGGWQGMKNWQCSSAPAEQQWYAGFQTWHLSRRAAFFFITARTGSSKCSVTPSTLLGTAFGKASAAMGIG